MLVCYQNTRPKLTQLYKSHPIHAQTLWKGHDTLINVRNGANSLVARVTSRQHIFEPNDYTIRFPSEVVRRAWIPACACGRRLAGVVSSDGCRVWYCQTCDHKPLAREEWEWATLEKRLIFPRQ